MKILETRYSLIIFFYLTFSTSGTILAQRAVQNIKRPPSQTEVFGAIPDWTILKFDTTLGFKQNFAPSSYYIKFIYDSLKYQCLTEFYNIKDFRSMVKENYKYPTESKDTNSFNAFFDNQLTFFEITFMEQLNRHSTLFSFYRFVEGVTLPDNSQLIYVFPKKINRYACGKKIRDENIATLNAEIYFVSPVKSSNIINQYNIKFSIKDELGVTPYKGPYSKLFDIESLTNFYNSEYYWGPIKETFSALGKKLGRIIRAYNEKGKLPKDNPIRYESNNFR